MNDLEASVDRVAAETGFSGVVRVDRAGGTVLANTSDGAWPITRHLDGLLTP
jgi:hypothetical protein